jgi:ABC-2 type transport system permease protein/oleandomycin transport system permease protein
MSIAAPARGWNGSLRWAVSDALTITWRNLLGITRIPELVVFSFVQPVMFVLLFRYVFGGAINVPGASYVDFLMPGIFVQTVMFGGVQTGIGLAEDLYKGLIERFRSLPMARSAVLAGRTLADVVRNVFVVIIMIVVGFAVGFRVHTSWWQFVFAMLLLIFVGYAFSWVMAIVGLSVGNAESAQAAAFPLIFPFVFASSAFVPTQTMPSWLAAFANHQPVSFTVDAVRDLVLGGPTATDVWVTIAYAAGMLAIFGPLAVRRYRRAVS